MFPLALAIPLALLPIAYRPGIKRLNVRCPRRQRLHRDLDRQVVLDRFYSEPLEDDRRLMRKFHAAEVTGSGGLLPMAYGSLQQSKPTRRR